jgi:hypothetical protein
MNTLTRDEPEDSAEQTLLDAARALEEQTPVTGAVGRGPYPVFNMEDFMMQVDNLPFNFDSDFGNQVFYAEQQSVQLADWGSASRRITQLSQDMTHPASLTRGPKVVQKGLPDSKRSADQPPNNRQEYADYG